MSMKVETTFRIEGQEAINNETGERFEFVGEPKPVDLYAGEKWVEVNAVVVA